MNYIQYDHYVNKLRKAKFTSVFTEATYQIFRHALVIDDAEVVKYESAMKNAVAGYLDDEVYSGRDVKAIKEFVLSGKVAPIILEMIGLAEDASDVAINSVAIDADEYPEVTLDLQDEEIEMIKDFSEKHGSATYGNEIMQRVVDTFKSERELQEKKQEEIAQLNNELSDEMKESVMAQSSVPETLYQAIFLAKSKVIINESANVDIMSSRDEILAESIVTFTILETYSALGVRTYTDKEKEEMKIAFCS